MKHRPRRPVNRNPYFVSGKYIDFDQEQFINWVNQYIRCVTLDEYIVEWTVESLTEIKRHIRGLIDVTMDGNEITEYRRNRTQVLFACLVIKLEFYGKPRMAECVYRYYQKVVLGK